MDNIKIKAIKGPLQKKYFHDLAYLRCSVFREYPYLYDGSIDYEKDYLAKYAQSQDFLLVAVFDGDKIVGASTAMPLEQEFPEAKQPFIHHKLPVEQYCYFGESVLEPNYRGKGIYHRFFEERENHAKALGLRNMCFCVVEREANHPKKTKGHRDLDQYWLRRGYKKQPQIVAHYRWKEVGNDQETVKPMPFWVKTA